MKPVPDHCAGETVARGRHAWKDCPTIWGRGIRLQGAKGGHHTIILKLSASHIYPILIGSPRYCAARARHPRLGWAPAISGWIILLDNVGVGCDADESGAGPATDHIDLAAYHADTRVIARCGHRRSWSPAIGGWIIFLHGADGDVRPSRMNDGLLCPRRSSCASDHVYLATGRYGSRCSALRGHWRERLP